MPKLSTASSSRPLDERDVNGKPVPEGATRCRPCPRCQVVLILERKYESRGLSGMVSAHEIYVCPACDARFQHNPAEGKWRELS